MRKLIILAAAIVVLGVGAIAAFYAYELLGSDDPNLATEAPAIPTATAGTTPAANDGGSGSTTAPAGVHHYTVDSAQSSAKYVVKETLRGVPDVTAVGTTNAITGDLYVSTQGVATTPKSTFKVDMTKIATDNRQRDSFVRDNTLETRRFPTAEFSIDSVTFFPAGYKEGDEVQLTLSGSLTLHGVTKPVTWAVKARQAGTILTATADTDIKMTDFGMTPPNVPTATAQNEVHLQVILVTNRVAG